MHRQIPLRSVGLGASIKFPSSGSALASPIGLAAYAGKLTLSHGNKMAFLREVLDPVPPLAARERFSDSCFFLCNGLRASTRSVLHTV